MKGSLIVIVFFCVGCIMGAFNKFEFDTHTVSMYILYALMLQVGISIGSNKNLKAIVSHLHPKMLLLPSLSPSSKNPPSDCNWLRNWEPLPY